jgi:hypothetical protein
MADGLNPKDLYGDLCRVRSEAAAGPRNTDPWPYQIRGRHGTVQTHGGS